MTDAPMLSLTVPMFNESEGIAQFFERVIPILEGITPQWEIVCVNDGSRDNTLEFIKYYHQREPRIRFVSLSRNFGKEAALSAGLDYARGQAVIPIDADLQDPPELIPEMVAKWREGFKVVLATRKKREGDGWFKRLTAHWFYRFIGRVSSVDIPENTGDFRLMDAQVVAAVRALPERARFMKGLFAWVGFSTTRIYFERPHRAAGRAKFNFRMMWRLAKDGIFSFTTLPLRISTYLGAVISMFSMGYAVFLVVRTALHGKDVPGYASIMTAVLFIGGIQLVSLGILGEYVGRVYRETKQRPLYVIEEASN